jgi:Flp pilus assembly protein TadB
VWYGDACGYKKRREGNNRADWVKGNLGESCSRDRERAWDRFKRACFGVCVWLLLLLLLLLLVAVVVLCTYVLGWRVYIGGIGHEFVILDCS